MRGRGRTHTDIVILFRPTPADEPTSNERGSRLAGRSEMSSKRVLYKAASADEVVQKGKRLVLPWNHSPLDMGVDVRGTFNREVITVNESRAFGLGDNILSGREKTGTLFT